MTLELILATLIAYLFGSLSSAVIVCKLMHLPDPRTQGSKNPGATNVLRIGGKIPAAITLLGDTLKGTLPVLLAKGMGMNEVILAAVTFAAFFGHLFPLFFDFKGGKGVATALGCLLALSWPAGLCWIATWLTVAFFSRYSSLAALIASLLAPLYTAYFTGNTLFATTIALISVLLIIRHRSNIANLLLGKETPLGKKK